MSDWLLLKQEFKSKPNDSHHRVTQPKKLQSGVSVEFFWLIHRAGLLESRLTLTQD